MKDSERTAITNSNNKENENIVIPSEKTVSSSSKLQGEQQHQEDNCRGDGLQHKLLRLSLDLDNKSKNVKLLQEALEDAKSNGSKEIQIESDRMRKRLEDVNEENRTTMSDLFHKCNEIIELKKSLADELEKLTCDKKKLVNECRLNIEKELNEGKKAVEELRSNFLEGAQDRERDCINFKTKEIRKLTIQGLEPEVKRIMSKHKETCNKIQVDFESRKKEMEAQMKKEIDLQLVELRIKTSSEADRMVAEARQQSADNISKIRVRRTDEITALRTKFQQERSKLQKGYSEELKEIRRENEEELKRLKEYHDSTTQEARGKLESEKRSIDDSFKKRSDKVNTKLQKEFTEWQLLIRGKFEQEFYLTEFNKMKEGLLKERDREIKSIIKLHEKNKQQQLAAYEKRSLREREEIKKQFYIDQKRYNEELQQVKNQVDAIRTRITKLQQEKEKQGDYLDKLSKNIQMSKSKLIDLKQKKLLVEKDASKQRQDLEAKFLPRIDTCRQEMECMNTKLKSLQSDLSNKELYHKESINRITLNHNHHLQELEFNVKLEMKNKVEELKSIKSQIEDENVKIEHLNHLIDRK